MTSTIRKTSKGGNLMSKKLLNLLLVVMMLAVFVPTTLAAPPAQEEGQDYVVVADDWLSKLAEKYLGNPMAYPAIVEYTNQKNAEDASYAEITDPDLIEVGWKIYIPSAAEAEAYAGPPAPAAAVPVTGGHLIIAFETGVEDTLDIAGSDSTHSAFIAANMYDTLIQKNPADGKYYPALAKSWELADDGLSITLYLRDDVTFHDGTPFNAQAVKFNFDRTLTSSEAMGGSAWSMLGGDKVKEVEVIDDYTVRISYNEPYALMVESLSLYGTSAIMSPTAIEKYGDEYGVEYAVGTGPFKFVEFTGPQGETVFERNDDYNWASPYLKHQGPPYLDGFTVKGLLEAATRSAAVESKAADVGTAQASDIARFAQMDGFKVWVLPRARFLGLWINTSSPFFQDVRTRQALSHAFDREGMLNSPTFAGVGEVANGPLSSGIWGDTSEFKPYGYWYDLEKAKTLLEEVGWKDEDGDGIREAHGVEGVVDGTPLRVVELVDAEVQEQSELLQGMLRKAGIDVDLQVHDHNTHVALQEAGEFDISFASSGGSNPFVMADFVGTGRQFNYNGYSNARVDELLALAEGSTDPEVQREAFVEIQQLILEDLWLVPAVSAAWPWAMREEVMDLTTDSVGYGLYLYDAWLNE
jgi:peptide/nickel transport system substrate-binding protein